MEHSSPIIAAVREPSGFSGGVERLNELQVLRFVAAMSVVLYHLFHAFKVDFGAERNYFMIGAYGVDVFFVLSGFVITYSARQEAGPAYFMMRRIARIVPLYWSLTLLIAAVALIYPRVLNSTTFNWANLLYSLLFIPFEKENGLVQPMLFLGWTLNYEMFFYTIFAATLWFRQWSPLYPCAIIGILVILGRSLDNKSTILEFYTNPIMLEFVFGVLLCCVWRLDRNLLRRYAALFFLVFICFATLSTSIETVPSRPFIQGVAALSLVALALSVTAPKAYWVSILVLFGNASYSLYLSHPYVIQLYSKILGNSQNLMVVALGAVTTLSLCVAVSLVLYFTIEVKAQDRLIVWWVTRRARTIRSNVHPAD